MNLSVSTITFWRLNCFFLIGLMLSGCSKDEDEIQEDPFYSGRDVNASPSDLVGVWAIHKVEFQGVAQDVPVSDEICGRDFLVFRSDNIYQEYYLEDTGTCTYISADFSWDLSDGVVTVANTIGQSEEMVVEYLDSGKWVFRYQLDVDEDGKDDIVKLTAYPYQPKDTDIYSSSFHRNTGDEHRDKIRLEWEPYQGFNSFDRYEIYRSENGCAKENATLIATISEKEVNYFVDPELPAVENLCYYFKLYNSNGLLGESPMYYVETGNIEVPLVELMQPEVSGNEINLQWEPYSGYYFSHYEITTSNYTTSVGSTSQEIAVATISERETVNYTDSDPPYFINPVYTIYAVNIFGVKSPYKTLGVNSREVTYSRPELLIFNTIEKIALSKSSPLVFMYGRSAVDNAYQLCSYNYESGTLVACSDVVPSVYSSFDMKIVETSLGDELVFPQGSEFMVFEASTLNYKYMLTSQVGVYSEDFEVLESGLWVLTDGDEVYTMSRNQDVLSLEDRATHFTAHQSYTGYGILNLEGGRILVGHPDEPACIAFEINADNSISALSSDVPMSMKQLFHRPGSAHIVNARNKTVLDAETYEVSTSFSYPAFTYTLSADGNKVLGSKNDPEGSTWGLYPHEKNVYIYDIAGGIEQTLPAKGYPHFVFETISGNIMSVSSGLLRDNLRRASQRADLFLEVVQ